MKKITLSLLFGIMSLVGFSQINIVENFDTSVTLPAGWTSDAEDYSVSFVENCDGRSVRSNFDNTNLEGSLTSPNEAGQSNATDLTIAFDYKIVDWSAATDPTGPGWGELYVQYSTNDGGTWNTVLTINDANHVTSNSCTNISTLVPAADLPIGTDFKLRIDAAWNLGTYYVYLDNIAATQMVSDPPSCVNLITPTNGSTGVSINTGLEWSTASGIPAGYTLSVGTTPGGTDLVDNENVGLSTTYTFPTALEYATTYYVTVLPFNSNGPAVGCTEFTFMTGADPNAPVDCASGVPVNVEYCYTDDDTMSWSFVSSDGGPLNIFFNAGEMEACCDDIIIYDGADNTAPELFNGNGGGDLNSVSANSTGDTLFIQMDTDGSINCQGLGFVPINFDVSCIDLTAVPNCNSVLTTPENGDISVDNNTDIIWSGASIIVTGYTISIGTTPGGTDILNNFDNGTATTYDPGTLLYETTYYVTIVPYNDNGPAINCSEQSFTIENDPNQTVDCTIGQVVNTVFCYENNDTMEFNFASNDGSQLVVVFNSGSTENNFDELVITDSDGTVIYNDYGNNGDLSGLVFTSSGTTITVGVTSDGSVVNCTNDPWDFDVSCLDPTAIPNCNSVLTAPSNGTVDVNENDDLNWSPATIFVTGYIISMGTSPGGTDVLDNIDVGDVLTYDPGLLDFDTTYYVTIIPYNDNGSAVGCNEESFTTRSDPNQIVDCSIGEVVNTTYCYVDNDTMEFNFASSDGSQLVVFFNEGWVEAGWDELIVTDSDGSIIFQGDNGGDLTGLFFISSGSTLTVGVLSDGVINCGSTGNAEWNFDVACFDPTAVPNCNAVVTLPADGAIDVDINTDINWTPASILVDGYTISIGTTPGGTDIVDNLDVGDVLTYNPGVLDNATNYYVTVVPYNTNGPAIGCTEYTFKTICIPQEVSFNAIGDCDTDPDNPDFVIEVSITDLSGATSIIISDDQGSPDQTATAAGIITMGPYTANTVVTITTIKSDDDTCDVISSPITFICPPPPNSCSIVFAGDDASVDCLNPETDLTASYHLFGQDTNTYVINGLDSCPLPPAIGGTPTSINTDDVWSGIIDLGFEFCFFGEVYDEILIGSNGVLSFELENADGFNGWNIDPGDTLPNNTNPTLGQANIFGVAHDIDPSVCGDINYLVIGSAPYRMFVVNYSDVCHFSCNDISSSSQIILYESSNNIDVNVFEKTTCPGWNDGLAVIGVQNVAGNAAFAPPGRNTGVWEVTADQPESWRFAPAEGTPNYTFEWLDENGDVVGNTDTITVSPNETTTYTASVTYELCTGGTSTVVDQVVVTNTGGTPVITDPADLEVCDEDEDGFAEFDLTIQDSVIINDQTGLTVTYHDTQDDADTGVSPILSPYTNVTNPEEIFVRVEDDATGCISTTSFFLIVNPAPVAMQPSDLSECDDDNDGFVEFDLTSQDFAIIGDQTDVVVSYHANQDDADNNFSALSSPHINTTNPQTIYVRVEDTVSGCVSMTTFALIVGLIPETTFITDEDYEICPNASTPIEVIATAGNYSASEVTIVWYEEGNVIPGETGLTIPVLVAGYYEIEVTFNDTQCTSITGVQVFEATNCVIPQVITPNDDGFNDTFDLSSFDVDSLEIFNRNGTKVFSRTNGYTNEFFGVADNGDELPVGTYFYVMKYEDGKVRTSWVYINK